jgi:multiple sugar transport system ATP-binding protein
MPKIVLEHVTKRWGNYFGVDDLNLVMEDNSFITLLGPSGCGKTTTLRMIAGLETPTSGKITIGDHVVFDSAAGINVPASKRKVGFLFQNYALWPNMTVYKNISFGLSNIKEEMSLIDYELKNYDTIIKVLSNPKELNRTVMECVDKKGKIDETRALIHIIDTFEVSIYTAKVLFKAAIEKGSEEALMNEYKTKASEERNKLTQKGISLSSDYEYIKNGEVIKKNRKLNKEEIDLAVRRVSRIVKIGEFMDRYPSELSGGQQQRVAIARTLAPNPHVLFMDEPLSNLDAKLRLEMRGELQRLHARMGATFVYVTHDQLEAMTLATKICLINNGVLQQYAEPLTVYDKPSNLFVADFVGNPSMNFIEVKAKEGTKGEIKLNLFKDKEVTFVPNTKLDLAKWQKETTNAINENLKKINELKAQKGYIEKQNKDLTFKYHIAKVEEDAVEEEVAITSDDYVLAVRPEFVKFGKEGRFDALVYSSMPTGMETTVRISIDGFLLTGVMFGGVIYKLDQKIKMDFASDGILLYDRKTGKLVAQGSIK